MAQDNPILNNPYLKPTLHYATDEAGALNYEDIRPGRRIFAPDIQAMPNRQGPQATLFEINELEAVYDKLLVNQLRKEVSLWRSAGYPQTTRVTAELLHFWFLNSERHDSKKLFFAQREAIETAVWLNEVADKSNPGTNLLSQLRTAQLQEAGLPRIAFKMATGTGKTVVMASLIRTTTSIGRSIAPIPGLPIIFYWLRRASPSVTGLACCMWTRSTKAITKSTIITANGGWFLPNIRACWKA